MCSCIRFCIIGRQGQRGQRGQLPVMPVVVVMVVDGVRRVVGILGSCVVGIRWGLAISRVMWGFGRILGCLLGWLGCIPTRGYGKAKS